MKMSEKNSLENLLERHKIYSEAGALGKDLQSKEINHRDNARNFLRDYHEGKNDIELPTDQPMSNEFYDWTVLGIQAESGRDNYWNVEKENCVSELSHKIIEENVLNVNPVKLNKDQNNYELHNSAEKLHNKAYNSIFLCKMYDAGKIDIKKLRETASEDVQKEVLKKLEGDKYLTNNEKGLVLRSALSTINISEVARQINEKITERNEKEFRDYFSSNKNYNILDYVKENLTSQENRNLAIEQVKGLYEQGLKAA